MIFVSSLRRSLLETGPDRRPRVPLRAYGKLPIASEFIDVGCETPALAPGFRQWIVDGWNLLPQGRGDSRPEIRAHRIAGTCQGRRAWVIATIVPSHDRLSPQGHQRHHPFAIFALLPALRSEAPALYTAASRIWPHLEAVQAELPRAADRADCAARIRAGSFPLAGAEEAARIDWRAGLERALLDDWLGGLPHPAPGMSPSADSPPMAMDRAAFAARLVHHAAFLRRGADRLRPVWRLPLAASSPSIAVQVCAWLAWLETNRQLRRRDFAMLLPSGAGQDRAREADGSPHDQRPSRHPTDSDMFAAKEACIVRDVLAPADFALLARDSATAHAVAPSWAAWSDQPSPDVRLAAGLADCRTLADFARLRLQR